MYRSALRPVSGTTLARLAVKPSAAPRFLSTAPPHRQSRSWKSSFARWGLAGAIVYYYNTSSVFADEPRYVVHAPPEISGETASNQSVDSILETRRSQAKSSLQVAPQPSVALPSDGANEQASLESPQELEEEASQQGAFNEETGEINWDCPCLGGMAYGPCGDQFRAAFSCFVYSKEDPKGLECIDHFKTMQNCFREHPEIYGSELEEDEVADSIDEQIAARPTADSSDANLKTSTDEQIPKEKVGSQANASSEASLVAQRERSKNATEQVQRDHGAGEEADKLVPRAAHDAR